MRGIGMRVSMSNLCKRAARCLSSTISWRAQKKQNPLDNISSGPSYLLLRPLQTGMYTLTVVEYTNYIRISLSCSLANPDFVKEFQFPLQRNLSKKQISLALFQDGSPYQP